MADETVAQCNPMEMAERRYLVEAKAAAAYPQALLPGAILALLEKVTSRIESMQHLVKMAERTLPNTSDGDEARAVLEAMSDMNDKCYEHANNLGGKIVHMLKTARSSD